MQLNIERGEPMTGKTVRLIQKAHEAGQDDSQIITARLYDPADLELLVRSRISRGVRVICIDECEEAHIKRLRSLKGDLPAALTIHAVVAN